MGWPRQRRSWVRHRQRAERKSLALLHGGRSGSRRHRHDGVACFRLRRMPLKPRNPERNSPARFTQAAGCKLALDDSPGGRVVIAGRKKGRVFRKGCGVSGRLYRHHCALKTMATSKNSSSPRFATIDGNEAAAYVAYRTNEVMAIYPITPSSPIAEWCDQWASEGKQNLWGTIPGHRRNAKRRRRRPAPSMARSKPAPSAPRSPLPRGFCS